MNRVNEIAQQLHLLLSYVWEDASDPEGDGVAEINQEDAGTLLDLINDLQDALDKVTDQ